MSIQNERVSNNKRLYILLFSLLFNDWLMIKLSLIHDDESIVVHKNTFLVRVVLCTRSNYQG